LCLRTADIDPSNDFALAAKISFEPKLTDAALHSNDSNLAETGRSVSVRYAYSLPTPDLRVSVSCRPTSQRPAEIVCSASSRSEARLARMEIAIAAVER